MAQVEGSHRTVSGMVALGRAVLPRPSHWTEEHLSSSAHQKAIGWNLIISFSGLARSPHRAYLEIHQSAWFDPNMFFF